MKIFNLVFLVLFIVFAALQYNDPDPYLWIPIYLYGAFICWMGYRGKMNFVALYSGLAVYIVYALYLFVAEDGVLSWIIDHDAENIAGTMKASNPWIEDSREFFGLVILITVLLINYFYFRKRTANRKRSPIVKSSAGRTK
jgi:Transmembrane family 220, helix